MVVRAPTGPVEKFGFDTVFEATGEVLFAAPRPKRTFSAEEVEQIKRAAEAAGEARAMAGIANHQAQALALIALKTFAEVRECASQVILCTRPILAVGCAGVNLET